MGKLLGTIAVSVVILGSCGVDAPASVSSPFHIERPVDQPVAFANGRIRTSNGITFTTDGRTLHVTQDIDGIAQILETRFVDD